MEKNPCLRWPREMKQTPNELAKTHTMSLQAAAGLAPNWEKMQFQIFPNVRHKL